LSKLNGFFLFFILSNPSFDLLIQSENYMNNLVNEPSNYYTRKESAHFLRCSTKKIDRLIKDGRINAFKVNRSVLIYAETLTEENLNSPKPKFL
jgi:excisionase family DNA binding protein